MLVVIRLGLVVVFLVRFVLSEPGFVVRVLVVIGLVVEGLEDVVVVVPSLSSREENLAVPFMSTV